MLISRYCILSILLLMFLSVKAQQFAATVKDKQTNSALENVSVVYDGKEVAATNSSGFFSFVLPANQKTLRVLLYGYGYQKKQITLNADADTIIYLEPLSQKLGEVTVTTYRAKRGNNTFTYTSADVKNIITVAGETDIMRYMQILPGVSQGMEGGMGFYVRGAGSGNSRVELDGIPIVAPTHLFGLFSTFHSDIVEKSVFQMGGISAASGNLLSSLLQIQTVTPRKDKYGGSVSVSPLMLGGALQGYILKNKLSFQLAARTSLLKPEFELLKKITDVSGEFTPQIQDFYTKLHWEINPRQSLNALLYASHDYFSYIPEPEENSTNTDLAFGWDNRAAKLLWTYTVNDRIKTETSAYYTHFNAKQRRREYSKAPKTQYGILFGSDKKEVALSHRLVYEKDFLSTNAGIDYRKQRFRPVVQKIALSSENEVNKTQSYNTSITSLFLESEYGKEYRYKLKGGLRYNLFESGGKKHSDFETRFYSSVFLTSNIGVEATYDFLTQFQHTLEGLPVGWALDLIVPATDKFRPEKSSQYYIGAFAGNANYHLTLGVYYKQLRNLTSYKSLLNQFSPQNVSWEEDVVQGKGTSYGLEMWIEKRNGRLTGSLAYTLSRATRQYAEINRGNPFPFKFDRPYNLNLQLQYVTAKTSKSQHSCNLSLYLSSGNKTTIPVSSYKSEELPFWNLRTGGIYVPPQEDYHASVRTEMSAMNDYALPAYFRIDAGYKILFKGRKRDSELSLSVFNILNRRNPYLVFYEKGKWNQLSLLPVIPSVNWRMIF